VNIIIDYLTYAILVSVLGSYFREEGKCFYLQVHLRGNL
jgi:hypothetical protein